VLQTVAGFTSIKMQPSEENQIIDLFLKMSECFDEVKAIVVNFATLQPITSTP